MIPLEDRMELIALLSRDCAWELIIKIGEPSSIWKPTIPRRFSLAKAETADRCMSLRSGKH